MKKYVKKHLKDEKRILKLMYRKGIFEVLKISLENIGWEYFRSGRLLRKRKGNRKYTFKEYLPELHTYSCDYWGEWDSHSVISIFKDHLWWETADSVDESGWPVGKMFNNAQLIRHLSRMPNVIDGNRINTFLKRTSE